MNNYKVTYTTESGRTCWTYFSADGDNEAIEAFEFWAEGANEILQFENCEEVNNAN